MRKIFWFNPENDSALATDSVAYTPSRGAALVHFLGSFLPLWLCDDDSDYVIIPDGCFDEAQNLKKRFNLSGQPVESAKVAELFRKDRQDGKFKISPWGWSRSAVTALAGCGVDRSLLPDVGQLEICRSLSGRFITVDINADLADCLTTAPIKCADHKTLNEALDSVGSEGVVKLPWSSSGRGVFMTSDYSRSKLTDIAAGAIRKQGYVMIEKRLSNVLDGAMLFRHSPEAGFMFKGLSLFQCSAPGVYGGNVVAPQPEMYRALERYIAKDRLLSVADRLTVSLNRHLSALKSFYDGWVGVDFMICRCGDGVFDIAPCVEVNLRTTMGVMAMFMSKCLARAHGNDTHFLLGQFDETATEMIDLSPFFSKSSRRFGIVPIGSELIAGSTDCI